MKALFILLCSFCTVLAQSWPMQYFVTEDFHVAELEINKTGQPVGDGYIFFAPVSTNWSQYAPSLGPIIMTGDGDLVWHPASSISTQPVDGYGPFVGLVDVQQFEGQSYLTYWSGYLLNGAQTFGAVHVLDDTYTERYTICLELKDLVREVPINVTCANDFHESVFTDRGTVLITVYNVTRGDLTPVGGPEDGWILDSQFYEVDIKSGEVAFAWKSADHLDALPVNLTHYVPGAVNVGGGKVGDGTSPGNAFDYFHLNCVSLLPDGGYLLGSRHLWYAIKLDRRGNVQWTLSGDREGGNFDMDPALHFAWQHDVRVIKSNSSSMLLTIANNGNSDISYGTSPTCGLLVSLDFSNPHNWTATLLHNYTDPSDPVYSVAEGTYQTLENGNVFLGYGSIPEMKEFTAAGNVVMTAKFGVLGLSHSYTTFKRHWVGRPTWKPKARVNGTALFMSWNGATGYDSWVVLAGESPDKMTRLVTTAREGFETSTSLASVDGAWWVKAVAYGKSVALGESEPVQVVLSG